MRFTLHTIKFTHVSVQLGGSVSPSCRLMIFKCMSSALEILTCLLCWLFKHSMSKTILNSFLSHSFPLFQVDLFSIFCLVNAYSFLSSQQSEKPIILLLFPFTFNHLLKLIIGPAFLRSLIFGPTSPYLLQMDFIRSLSFFAWVTS